MSRPPRHHPHRMLTLLVLVIALLIPTLSTVARIQPLQPVQNLQTEPTETPGVRIPDTRLLAQPTAEPTAVATELPITNTESVATEEPTESPDTEPIEIVPVADLVVRIWACPAGFVLDSLASANLTCTTSLDGVVVDLDSADAGVADRQDTSGTTTPGAADFYAITPGTWAMQPQTPLGYTDPALLFCDDLNDPASADPVLQGGAYHEIDLEADAFVECHWIMVLDNDNHTVDVTKAVCPEGIDTSVSYWELQPQCTTLLSDVTFTLTDATSPTDKVTDASGRAKWTNVDLGDSDALSIIEHIPEGYGEPVVWCVSFPVAAADPSDYEWFPVVSSDGAITVQPEPHEPFRFACTYFNIPETEEPNDLTIHKWECPEGTDPAAGIGTLAENCTTPMDGIAFAVSSDIGIAVLDTVGGVVGFGGLPTGTIGIQETIPEDFGEPRFACHYDNDGFDIPAVAGRIEIEVFDSGQEIVCHVFNIPGQPPSVTIFKWTCPPGYDYTNPANDPTLDCTEATDGVDFQFGPTGDLAHLQTTGTIIPGGVFFEDLTPGTWKAVELVPDGIEAVFVPPCTGFIMGVLQPLHVGNVLEIDVAAGEHIVCNWYNVPEPEDGQIDLVKYICSTASFVSPVECQIEEDGVTFDLLFWNGADWVVLDTATTDGFGRITWTGLEPGDYWLAEHDGEWCHISASPSEGGDSFGVNAGDISTVDLYNCGDTPGDPGDTPTKYPDTGVPPATTRHEDFRQSLPRGANRLNVTTGTRCIGCPSSHWPYHHPVSLDATESKTPTQ